MDKLNRFIEKAKIRHKNKYSYDKVIYVSSKDKVEITCDIHGSFFVRPDAHIRKVGCPKCSGGVKYDNSTFIDKCIQIRGLDYLYDKVDYKNSITKVMIGCKEHGYFNIRPANFLSGQGCSKCGGVYKRTNDDFILDSKLVHGDLYDYSLCDYKNSKEKVTIICNKHGEFQQTPKEHINGHGCSLCNLSRGENRISNLLNLLGIEYKMNWKFDGCNGVNGGNLPFDFYIPDKNLVIEYDGRQHYEPVELFGGQETYNKQVINDRIRDRWCLSNGIDIIRVSYKENDEKILNSLSSLYGYNFNNFKKTYYELLDYLKTISSDIIIDNPKCDFLLRDRNIAIRIIGFWRNCDKNQNKKTNIELKNEFNDMGINLINIFEDYWTNKKEIVKSRLQYNTLNSNRIMARKCDVRVIDDTCRDFLNKNHIQGFIGSKIKIGLYYENELVSLITFGGLRKNMGGVSKKGSYELLRFCNKIGYIVVGAASKLFNFFIKNFKPESVISYADLSWTNLSGNVYEKIGLKKDHISKPSYYYINGGLKYNRFLYRKDILVSKGADRNKTEFEICDSLGYLRVYDTGTYKYSWTNK